MAKKIPWSGWYWPTSSNPPPMAEKNGPLDKFDQYIKNETNQEPDTRKWELSEHYEPGCGWCGHCHGWAAAAILECEPIRPITSSGIEFTIGDLKGLLTEVHCTDGADLWRGWRDMEAPYEDDDFDVLKRLKAYEFHQVLLDWVGNGEPVVMDTTKGSSVTNHPAYDYKMISKPDPADPDKTHITCTVWFVSYGVDKDFVGTKDYQETYTYWIKGDFKHPYDGDWEGSSQNNKPGFIWHPDHVLAGANVFNPPNPATYYYQPYIEALTKYSCPRLIAAVPPDKVIYPCSAPCRRPPIPDMPPYNPINPLLFRGLVALDASEGYAVPAMATSWDMSEDSSTYIFHLREGVAFHDGVPLKAEDVAFTYNAMMNPDLKSPYYKALKEIIADVKVVDNYTVSFSLKQAMTDFPTIHGWHWILPQHVIEKVGFEAFSTHPIGSGPFAFRNGELGNRLTLIANPNYYLGKPRMDRIEFIGVPDIDRRLDILLEGRVDIAHFDHTLELERRVLEMPHLRTFAITASSPAMLAIQSIRLKGHIPNKFDGAWNAENWDIDFKAPGLVTAPSARRLLPRRVIRRDRGMSASSSEHNQTTLLHSPSGMKDKEVLASNPDARFLEWRVGVCWQIQVRQRNLAARVSEPGWTLPFRMLFEIVGEEVMEDKPCYRIKVTYPDRPPMAEYKYADVWVSKDERIPLQGTLHIGDRNIPMHYDFLMELLRTTPMKVDIEGIRRTLIDPRWPEEKIELQAFETRTSTGGSRLSSLAAPFMLRIDEPNYIVELQDWEFVYIGKITGTVVYKSTNKPVEGAKVLADTGQSAITKSDGTYELIEVPTGDRLITTIKADCKDARTIVSVEKDKVVIANLELICEDCIIADCAIGLGKFDQMSGGYPIIDDQELYNGKLTCKAVDVCGIQAHAGYYLIGSGGKEFEFDIDKCPTLNLTIKAEKDTDTCLLLMVHDKKPSDHISRFVVVGKTHKGNYGFYNVGKGWFEIKDDGQWHDYTYDLIKLREEYPNAETIKIVQFYSYRNCDGTSHAFHLSRLVL